jgi:TolA-binding protein
MNRTLKIILYLVLLSAACVLAVKFHHAYQAVRRASPSEEAEPGDAPRPLRVKSKAALTNAATATNVVSATTELAATNTTAPTNQAAGPSPAPGASGRSTNASPALAAAPAEPTLSVLMVYGIGLFAVVLFLGLLLAHDFSDFVAERFTRFMLSQEGEELKAPEYDKAEQLAMDSRPLEAIQMMRDYLKKNPRKLYVALRIAEIYEKELGNYLAAALEYEEVLKHRLRPEQWGWAAIHLANLYSGKLDQTGKAVALLRRIDSEYGNTAAAAKARARLSQLEGEGGGAEAAAATVEIEEEPAPPSNLPRGFRPK